MVKKNLTRFNILSISPRTNLEQEEPLPRSFIAAIAASGCGILEEVRNGSRLPPCTHAWLPVDDVERQFSISRKLGEKLLKEDSEITVKRCEKQSNYSIILIYIMTIFIRSA